MIDLHFHLLPGIDDGPPGLDEAVALARAAASAGTSTVVATPHVSWTYPNDASTIERLTDTLRARLQDDGVALEVLGGAEIAMTRISDVAQTELKRLCLGASDWILLEPPFGAVATGLDTVVGDLQGAGHRVLIAHPERCVAFRRDPTLLEDLVSSGALTSITSGSLVGAFGEEARLFALTLVREDLVHNVASDAHDLERRPPLVLEHLRAAGLTGLAEWLTEAVPAALLAGSDIPPRPDVELAILDPDPSPWWRRRVGRLRRAL